MNYGIQNILYDACWAHAEDIDRELKAAYVRGIKRDLLENNEYYQDLESFRNNLPATPPARMPDIVLSVQTHRMEVGLVVNQNLMNSTRYVFRTKENQSAFLTNSSGEVEPLTFPLLFPHGERGWGSDLKEHNIQLMPYLAARLLQPERDLEYTLANGQDGFLNRFDLFSRLSQYFVLEGNFSNIDIVSTYSCWNSY